MKAYQYETLVVTGDYPEQSFRGGISSSETLSEAGNYKQIVLPKSVRDKALCPFEDYLEMHLLFRIK